jgi:hypothetical protein
MIIFPITIVFLFLLILWQSVLYLRIPQGHPLRKMILARFFLLLLVLGLSSYAWRSALYKEVDFLKMLPPYPEAHFSVLSTPLFSDSPYWTYSTSATPDQVFNWYRSRSKHAGWTIEDQGIPNARVFVIVIQPRKSIFVVLQEKNGKTTITYTTEGEMMRKRIEP